MKYFAGFLIAVGMLILVFILIIRGFSGRDAPKVPQITLSDYSNTSTVVRLTIDGPLVADQNHKGLRITIGRDQNTLQTYQGYQNAITSEKSFPNNQNAYDTFLRSLQLFNFTKGSTDPALADERGFCPSGQRYIYQIISNNDTDIQRFWSTSCGGQGNFGGNPSSIRTLFKRQIPEYDKLTSGFGF